MSVIRWINHERCDEVFSDDRGLLYGDGIFRSLRVHNGRACHWQENWACFQRDAAALHLPLPDEAAILRDIASLSEHFETCSVRLTWTRGVGARGYAFPNEVHPNLMMHAAAFSPTVHTDGVALEFAQLILSHQPRLAGVKHLNRLEHILAKNEPHAAAVFDVLLCDAQQCVIESTMANVFALQDGVWVTPKLDRCGVSGATRAWLGEHLAKCGEQLYEVDISREQLCLATECCLGNAVQGIIPVKRIGQYEFNSCERGEALANAWIQTAFE